MTEKTDNPLGSLASYYIKKTNGILLNLERQTLEFYPAGFTQRTSDKANLRQQVLKRLWEEAVSTHSEEHPYPLSHVNHNITLLHHVGNPVDPNALFIIFETREEKLKHISGVDIGYIPKRLSYVVRNHINMITGGRILKVRANWNKGLYTAKLILGYNGSITPNGIKKSNRFTNLADEL